MMERFKGEHSWQTRRGNAESLPVMTDLPGSAALSAERAASAAESASQAAQSAAGAVERLGGWLALLASQASQPPVQAPQAIIPEAALAGVLEQESGKQGKGVTESFKRAAMTMGQRVSDLSEGRYGLETQPPKAETKLGRKAEKRLKRLAQQEARAEQPGAGVHWVPWMIGMSLGLVIGLIGVAYWQRRRLQDLWGQTSQRMQQTTEHMRQRLEASRSQPPSLQSNMPSGTPNFTALGSSPSVTETNRQANGRIESTLP